MTHIHRFKVLLAFHSKNVDNSLSSKLLSFNFRLRSLFHWLGMTVNKEMRSKHKGLKNGQGTLRDTMCQIEFRELGFTNKSCIQNIKTSQGDKCMACTCYMFQSFFFNYKISFIRYHFFLKYSFHNKL